MYIFFLSSASSSSVASLRRGRRIASFGALTISISPRSAARCVSKYDRVEGAGVGWCGADVEADDAPAGADADDEDIIC